MSLYRMVERNRELVVVDLMGRRAPPEEEFMVFVTLTAAKERRGAERAVEVPREDA